MITGSIPDLRVVIREAVNDNLTVDVPNLNVRVVQGDDYNVSIASPDVTTVRSGSFSTYADLAGQVVTASYAISASIAITALTSSYFSGSVLNVSGSITGSGLLLTTAVAASASAGGTYTSAEQDLINQIKATLIKYGMLT